MARLSVNLNKIALLRNSRSTGTPGVVEFARIALDAGGLGITVHPRPDERHITRQDVLDLDAFLRPVRPGIEFNIEGRPTPDFMDLCAAVAPEQVTLVPDGPGVLTSEEGWTLTDPDEIASLKPVIARLKGMGARVCLFIDPVPEMADGAVAAGADGIEIYTGAFAAAVLQGDYAAQRDACRATAARAASLGLVVNAGHDLTCENLPLLLPLEGLREASIGHELTRDALKVGFSTAVIRYAAALGQE